MNSILSQCIKSNLLLASIVWLMLPMTGCAQTKRDSGYNPEYHIGFLNKTGHDLDEVSLYDTNNKVWGLPAPLVAGGQATQGWITPPIPLEAEVRVVDKGEHKTIKVSLKDVPKKGFHDGIIYFVINADYTVDVKPIKSADSDEAVALVMSARPRGEYRLGFVNKTGRDLKAVAVFYGDKQAGSGGNILVRVKVGCSDPLTLPFPSEVEVRWKEDDADHAVKTKLEGIVPKGYATGTIFFVIKPDNTVEVHPVKWGDDKGAAKLVK